MEKYKRLEESENDHYSCFGAGLSSDGTSENSYVNAVLNVIFNINGKFIYKLPEILQESIENGAMPSSLIEVFNEILEQHANIMMIESK